ncbi:MAG: hypothetical protein ACKVS8_11150 [Phycisphaerales bacterium]
MKADYTLSPVLGLGATTVVAPGDNVAISLVLTSPVSTDVHNSAVCRVEFSVSGFILEQFAWSPPYQTGGLFDDSIPAAATLPVMITDDLVSGFGYPANVADIELSNVVPTGTFSTGTLATIRFRVPSLAAGTHFTVRAVPDTFANGFDEIPTTQGEGLAFIVVVPSPHMSWSALGLAAALRHGRRR